MKLKTGQLLVLTTGEYSDYGIRDYVRVLRDFDTKTVSADFIANGPYLATASYHKPGQAPSDYGSDDRFQAWAIREGYFEPVAAGDVAEWHLGSYSRFEPTA